MLSLAKLLKTGGAVLSILLALPGCSGLRPVPLETEHVYMLEARLDPGDKAKENALTLLVSPPRATPGYDTPRMVYIREPHALEYFSRNRWADTPAKMFGAQLVRAMEQRSGFKAVAAAGGQVKGDLRLDTEILSLRQDFTSSPSVVHIELRAQLLEMASYRLVATRLFQKTEAAPSDDPYGGVIAANRALKSLLAEIAEFISGNTPR